MTGASRQVREPPQPPVCGDNTERGDPPYGKKKTRRQHSAADADRDFMCQLLTQLNQRDEMTYDEMVQLFEQQKVEAFRFTDSSTLMLQVKGSDQPVRCRIHDYTLFYSDLNDLVKEQKAAGIIKSYSYPPPEGTDWLGIMLPYLMMALMFGGMWYLMSVRAQGGMGPDRMAKFGSAQIRGLSEKDKQALKQR